MNDTELQIVISVLNEAAGQLSEVIAQLSQIGTTAQDTASEISSSLTAAEEAAADAAIAAATQWDNSTDDIVSTVEDASGAIASTFNEVSDAALATANSMSEGWQSSIQELEDMMTSADSEIVAAATTAGEEAGTAAGEGFGGYFKKMIVGYALEQIGTFLSGGIDSAIASVSASTDKIATLNAQIRQQKADIDVNEAALQKWNGTTAEVNAAHIKAAANIAAERVKITELTQELGPLTQAQAGLGGQLQDVADKVLVWVANHKQLDQELQTFTTTLGPMLKYLGEALIVITLLGVAVSVIDPVLMALIAAGIVIATLTSIWSTFHSQIVAFFDDLDAKTGIITLLKSAWQSIVTEFESQLGPALAKLWTALQPLMPYIKDLAAIAFALLIEEIKIIVPLIVDVINGFTDLLTAAIKIETFFTNTFVGAINAVGNALNSVFNSAAFKAVSGLLGGAVGGISSAVNAVGAAASVLKVNDAIITPSGQVIQTDVADYLFATKNPGALASAGGSGAGGNINININGGMYLNSASVQQLTQAIMTSLNRQKKLVNHF